MQKVTVIGLGSMGAALARCLLAHGQDVTVWNRSPARAEAFADAGATVAGSLEEAVAASPFLLTCIKSHKETRDLLAPLGQALGGKTVCDMSTGDSSDADLLVEILRANEADYMLGMINAYPSGIGLADTTILTVGSDAVWSAYGDIVRTLGGASARIGNEPAALAAMFAGLFTVRQGFMFGMIYGALACRQAAVPLKVFADQVPASIKLVQDYYDVFARTVPESDFDAPEASMEVYALALEDALNTFKAVGAPAEFVQLMHDRTKAAVDAGLGGKQLTALVDHIR